MKGIISYCTILHYYTAVVLPPQHNTYTDQQQPGQSDSHVSYKLFHAPTVWPISLRALKIVAVRVTSELDLKQGKFICKCRSMLNKANFFRFGHVYLKMYPESAERHTNSTEKEWISSQLLKTTSFSTEYYFLL